MIFSVSLVFFLALIGMEFWAAFVHRHIYHGILWPVHRSHHRKSRKGRCELNDVFVVAHALVAMGVLAAGVLSMQPTLTASGAGISAYGILYALVHDGYIHQRLPLRVLDRFSMFRRIREDHLYHHTGDPGAHFGLFFWNRKYDSPRSRGEHAT